MTPDTPPPHESDSSLDHPSGSEFAGKLAPGTVIDGKYQVLQCIGAGGMGEVYRALHLLMERDVALKILPDFKSLPGHAVERFRREPVALAQLDHPAIVKVHDSGALASGEPFIVMDLVSGPSLATLLAQGALEPTRALDLMRELADALAHAHEKGIVHRDLKPSNLLVENDSQGQEHLRVIDFGIAKTLDSADQKLTSTGALVGSAPYMSPEQSISGAVDTRSDIYSFGCVLVELLTGKPPFEGDNQLEVMYRHLNTPFNPSVLKEFPSSLVNAVSRCLQKDPAQRYQSTRELKDDLGKVTIHSREKLRPELPSKVKMLALGALVCGLLSLVAIELVKSRAHSEKPDLGDSFHALRKACDKSLGTKNNVLLGSQIDRWVNDNRINIDRDPEIQMDVLVLRARMSLFSNNKKKLLPDQLKTETCVQLLKEAVAVFDKAPEPKSSTMRMGAIRALSMLAEVKAPEIVSVEDGKRWVAKAADLVDRLRDSRTLGLDRRSRLPQGVSVFSQVCGQDPFRERGSDERMIGYVLYRRSLDFIERGLLDKATVDLINVVDNMRGAPDVFRTYPIREELMRLRVRQVNPDSKLSDLVAQLLEQCPRAQYWSNLCTPVYGKGNVNEWDQCQGYLLVASALATLDKVTESEKLLLAGLNNFDVRSYDWFALSTALIGVARTNDDKAHVLNLERHLLSQKGESRREFSAFIFLKQCYAEDLARAGNASSALSEFQDTIEKTIASSQTSLQEEANLVASYLKTAAATGKAVEAMNLLKRLEKRCSESGDGDKGKLHVAAILVGIGEYKEGRKEFGEALQNYRRGLECLDGTRQGFSVSLHNLCARVLRNMGRLEEAELEARKAVAIEPVKDDPKRTNVFDRAHEGALMQLADIQYCLGKWSDAEASCREVIQWHSDHRLSNLEAATLSSAYGYLLEILLKQQKYSELRAEIGSARRAGLAANPEGRPYFLEELGCMEGTACISDGERKSADSKNVEARVCFEYARVVLESSIEWIEKRMINDPSIALRKCAYDTSFGLVLAYSQLKIPKERRKWELRVQKYSSEAEGKKTGVSR